MEEEREAKRTPRFCANCGSKARAGNAFCVNCGVKLYSEIKESDPQTSGRSETPTINTDSRPEPLSNRIREKLSGNELIRGVRDAFADLPTHWKLALICIVALLILIVASPITSFVTAIVFGMSVVTLVVGRIRRQPMKWIAVAAASAFALCLFSVGASNLLYGSDPVLGLVGLGRQEEEIFTSVLEATEIEGAETSAYGELPPEVAPIAEDWPSRAESLWPDENPPLFIPSYLPFAVNEAWVLTDLDSLSYTISMADAGYFSGDAELNLTYLGDGYLNSSLPGVEAFTMSDGQPYYYSYEFAPEDSARGGIHSIVFWEEPSLGEAENSYRLSTTSSAVTPDEFAEILVSMNRMED